MYLVQGPGSFAVMLILGWKATALVFNIALGSNQQSYLQTKW